MKSYEILGGADDVGDVYCSRCAPNVDEMDPVFADMESDVPLNCVTCQELIAVRLTSDGARYVLKRITDFVLDGHGSAPVLREWWEEYGDVVREMVDQHLEQSVEVR